MRSGHSSPASVHTAYSVSTLPFRVCLSRGRWTDGRPANALVLTDAPHVSFGLPTLSKYHPLVDETYPMGQRVPRFYSWVSTYYTHSDLARKTHNPALLDTTPLPYPAPPCVRHATLDAIAPATLEAVSWPGPIQGSEALLHGMPLGLALEQTHRMLLDPEAGRTLPQCKVVVVWGENTLWEMAGAAWAVEKLYKEHKAIGQVGRVLEVVEMPGANHFVRSFKNFLQEVCVYSAADRGV